MAAGDVGTSALPVTKGRLEVGCCLALGPLSNRWGAEYQNAAYKHNGCCRLHGGLSTSARTQRGLQRISEANLKHGRQTKDKLAAQRHAAKVGRRVMGELKRIEGQLFAAVKRCVSAIINDTHFYLARLCYLVD